MAVGRVKAMVAMEEPVEGGDVDRFDFPPEPGYRQSVNSGQQSPVAPLGRPIVVRAARVIGRLVGVGSKLSAEDDPLSFERFQRRGRLVAGDADLL